mmetsp:Transcript_8409/g.21364  ORF Transcript_8409/g.21364 Transcript_8409/m.21364 type:complete len:181 (+) Transcript_8409:439-981(+)
MEELALTIQGDALAAKQAWDEISASAAPVLAALCNGLIEASFTSEPSNWGVLRGNHVVQEAVLAKLQLDRQQLLDQLNSAVDKLSFWYDELKTLLFQVRQHCDAVAGLAKPEKLVARTCSVFDFGKSRAGPSMAHDDTCSYRAQALWCGWTIVYMAAAFKLSMQHSHSGHQVLLAPLALR